MCGAGCSLAPKRPCDVVLLLCFESSDSPSSSGTEATGDFAVGFSIGEFDDGGVAATVMLLRAISSDPMALSLLIVAGAGGRLTGGLEAIDASVDGLEVTDALEG